MKTVAQQAWPIVRNDLRLFWREVQGSRPSIWSYSLLIALFVIMHVAVISGMWRIKTAPPPGVEVLGGIYVALAMLGGTIHRAIQLLHTRSDFDLLLSSPTPPRAVLLARVGSMALTAGLTLSIFTAPVLNGLILRVSPYYLAGYAVLAVLALFTAAAGIAICLLLVRWFGAVRARLMAIAIGAVLGGGLPLIFSMLSLLPKARLRELQTGFVQLLHNPTMTFLAGANRGALLPLALFALVTLLTITVALRMLTRTFVAQLQDNNISRGHRHHEFHHRWVEGLIPATWRKELRLIARSPLLMVQLLPTMIISLLAAFMATKFLGSHTLAPAALFCAAFFSFLLADVASSGEVGWDLVRLSPARESRLRGVKMAACMAVPVTIAAALTIWIAMLGRPWLALLTLFFSVLSAAGSTWIAVVTIGPSPRYDLLQPPNPTVDLRQLLAQVIVYPGTIGLGLCSYEFHLLAVPFLGLALICVIASFTLLEPRATD